MRKRKRGEEKEGVERRKKGWRGKRRNKREGERSRNTILKRKQTEE